MERGPDSAETGSASGSDVRFSESERVVAETVSHRRDQPNPPWEVMEGRVSSERIRRMKI